MYYYLMLLGAGTFAGFMNVTAGGGSLITLPLLILTGMNPVTANGTNRIAVLIQNLFAAGNFRRHGRRDLRNGLLLGLAAAPGAAAGALTALTLPDAVFKAILAGAILLGLLVVFLHHPARHCGTVLRRKWLQVVIFVFIGFYGGLIQAGTGYLIIFSLTLVGGLELAATNSLKVVIIAVYLIPSIIVFASGGNIEILPGLFMAAGNGIGGVLGSNFSQKAGSGWIKAVLALALMGMAAKLLTG
jgi:uncharacterized membrane protein YfcA